MGHRVGSGELIWIHAPEVFGFLGERWGFDGPERISDGVALHRLGLHVSIEFLAWNRDAEFVTTLSMTEPDGRDRIASLSCLYVACGLGAAQDVPGSATPSRHVIVKRISQHAEALRQVMPFLEGPGARELFRLCHRREGPGEWRA